MLNKMINNNYIASAFTRPFSHTFACACLLLAIVEMLQIRVYRVGMDSAGSMTQNAVSAQIVFCNTLTDVTHYCNHPLRVLHGQNWYYFCATVTRIPC